MRRLVIARAAWPAALVFASSAFLLATPLGEELLTEARRLPWFGLPPVPQPEENPSTPAKILLGKKLFSDPGLSSDGTVSCAHCHRPDRFFADDRRYSTGVGGKSGDHNTPTLVNAAYSASLMSDGRSTSLEDQVRYPVTHPREMGMTTEQVEDYLTASADYPELFRVAFNQDWIGWEEVCQALAAFERTLVSGDAPFDRYFAGAAFAIPTAAARGWELFRGKAGCITCHHYAAESPFFTDFDFHNSGIGWSGDRPHLGRYQITKTRADKGAFRTPTLRNVAGTSPYMHDGSLPDLAAVLEHYDRGGSPNPLLDPRLRPLGLTTAEKEDLLAFLGSLTSVTTPGDSTSDPFAVPAEEPGTEAQGTER